jgi:Family of unknown function (DUF6339)
MTRLELRRFAQPVTTERLVPLLAFHGDEATETFGEYIDFNPVRDKVDQLLNEGGKSRVSTWDAALAPVVHGALRGCSRRTLLDMRLWHWMAVTQLQDYVLRRWCRLEEIHEELVLPPAQMERFLGRPTLRGVSRNAVARLYWVADALYSPEEGYSLVDTVLGNQDFFQNIFERKFGLYPPAAKVCARQLSEASEADRRRALKLLNLYASTIALESLEESNIIPLVASTTAS